MSDLSLARAEVDFPVLACATIAAVGKAVRDEAHSPGIGWFVLAVLASAYLVVSAVGLVRSGASPIKRDTVLAAVAAAGTLVIGLRQRRAFLAHTTAFEASMSRDDVLPDDWMPVLAKRLEGEVLPADPALVSLPAGVVEREGDDISAEWFERVAFRREGQDLLVYRSDMVRWRYRDAAGPGVYTDRTYLRVRATSGAPQTAFVTVEDPSALPATTADRAALVAAMSFDGADGPWLKERMPLEALEIIAARPLFVVRCHAGLVEVLWSADVSPNLASRFEDAIRLLLLVRRALHGIDPSPFR